MLLVRDVGKAEAFLACLPPNCHLFREPSLAIATHQSCSITSPKEDKFPTPNSAKRIGLFPLTELSLPQRTVLTCYKFLQM